MANVNRLDYLIQAAITAPWLDLMLEAADSLSDGSEHSDQRVRTKQAVLPILRSPHLASDVNTPVIDLTADDASDSIGTEHSDQRVRTKQAVLPILRSPHLNSDVNTPVVDLTADDASDSIKHSLLPTRTPKSKKAIPLFMQSLLEERKNNISEVLAQTSNGSKKKKKAALLSSFLSSSQSSSVFPPLPADFEERRKRINDWFIKTAAGKTGNKLKAVALEAQKKFKDIRIEYPLSGLLNLLTKLQ